MSWDPDLDLEHGVLHNRLKITDPVALAAAEAVITALRINEVTRAPIPGGYDLPHLQHMHWYILGDVYPFAGRLRTVRIGKGGHAFCPPDELASRAPDVFDRRTDPGRLRTLDRRVVLTELADLMADIIWLHPFREGNGRATRTFVAQLSAASGRSLTWDGLDADRNRATARLAHEGDRGPLRTLLDERLDQ